MSEFTPQRSGRVQSERERDPPQSKATLFCPACDHESSIDGDWYRHVHRERVELVCPDCETTIADRPRDGPRVGSKTERTDSSEDGRCERDSDRERGGERETDGERSVPANAVAAWSRALLASSMAWRTGVRAGVSNVTALVSHGR